MANCFTWALLGVVGVALDIAGAVALGLSFAIKNPESIRRDIPKTVEVTTYPGQSVGVFPPGLARSLARQRAESRLGLTLLVTGFGLQAASYFFEHDGYLTSASQRVAAGPMVALVWALAFILWKTYVPWDERRTNDAME